MCGRYAIHREPERIAAHFQTRTPLLNLRPRYNAAPTQQLPVVRRDPESGERSLDLLRWGLVPVWAKDLSIGSRMINARAEGIDTKPAFRSAFKRRRCLVPADNFYEWRKEGSAKQPYAIARKDGELLAFAGLWEGWKDPAAAEEEWVRTFTIVTTEASAFMEPIHNRMPVILNEADWPKWLGEEEADQDTLLGLLKPFPEALHCWKVDPRVGKVREDDPGVIGPLSA